MTISFRREIKEFVEIMGQSDRLYIAADAFAHLDPENREAFLKEISKLYGYRVSK